MHAVARTVSAGDDERADRELRALLEDVGRNDDPRGVGLYVFGAAIARRLAGTTADQANLYLNQFDVPQIHLFNLLGRAVPFVGLATKLANEAIARAIAGKPAATVIDVGIGTGRQMCALVDDLATSKQLPARLTILGIEPSDWALEEAKRNVEEAGKRTSSDVLFHPVLGTAESLTQGDWRALRAACTTRPVVNASFALHHIGDDRGRDQRNDVLSRLRSLDPSLLVLSEPDVDHKEPRFYERFRNCWAHFGAVFRTLDRLPIDQRDRNALKVCFFGREISDILSNPEDQRSERHESASSWLSRLEASGFRPAFDGELPPPGTDAVRLANHASHASIDALDGPVVSIFTAAPSGALEDAEGAIERAPESRVVSRVERPVEIEVYLAVLAALAAADDVLHVREREFIEQQAAILRATRPAGTQDLDELLAHGKSFSRRTREAIVRDLVFLAWIDGEYADEERTLVASIAQRLGVDDVLPALEASAALPRETAHMPSWFVEQWYLAHKRAR